MTDFHTAAHQASLLAINCAAADIAENARASDGDHRPDGGYNSGLVEERLRDLAKALGYTIEPAETLDEHNWRTIGEVARTMQEDVA